MTVRERPIPEPGPGEVRVRTERSAISTGTELLVYQDEVPADVETDATLAEWLSARRRQVEAGELTYLTHQLDLLGRYGKAGPGTSG